MFKMFMKDKKGFTLVELMVVVVILGILVAIAVPVYNNVTQNAKDKADESNIRIIESAIQMYLSNNPDKTMADVDVTTTEGEANTSILAPYIKDWPTTPGQYSVSDGVVSSTYTP